MTSRDGAPLRVAIIGAGMSGILGAIKLREAGIDDFTIYEKADEVGGTWRENRYPGIACDVPSHLYSYSFEPNPDWSHRFSPGSEIQRYFEEVTDRHGLRDGIRFGDEVTSLEWADGRWTLQTRGGVEDRCDMVIAATGVLHHPYVPELDGVETFGGACFHSARWDPDVELDDRRIGVVGTGSTGVQITGALAPRARRYLLFQRTPQWILPYENPPYSDDERALFRSDPAVVRHMRDEMSRRFAEGFSNAVVDASSPHMAEIEELCRANLEENVADPELRERLRPDYRAACKRLVIAENFYQALQLPQSDLVTEPIERVEPDGIRTADGQLHELDVVVLATGFRPDRFLRPIAVTGDSGVRLDDVWAERPTAYLSISIPDFPNLFMLNGPNAPVGNFSLIEIAELQFDYILQLIDLVRRGRCTAISATAAALEEFDEARTAQAMNTIWATGCRSWYLDDRGIPSAWPWTFDRFREAMAAPELDHYQSVTTDPAATSRHDRVAR